MAPIEVPIIINTGFVKGLIGARLVSAWSATTLHDKYDTARDARSVH
jgi:hypothetical protein